MSECQITEVTENSQIVETWEAWMDGARESAVTFTVPLAGTFDFAEAGAKALGVDVCAELNVSRA